MPLDAETPNPADALAARIEALDLAHNIREMKEQGWTVIQDPAAHAMTDRLREAIIRCVPLADEALQRTGYNLLDADPAFSDAMTTPKILTMMEHMLGRGFQIAQVAGSRRRQGDHFLPLHSDNSWWPAPFPEWEISCTACWVTDEFSLEGGATAILPGSHRLKGHPPRQLRKSLDKCIPIVAPKGSLCLWDGAIWHGNYPRQTEGERIVLHMSYVRLGLMPTENYDHLGDDWFEGKHPQLRELLGRTHFLNRFRGRPPGEHQVRLRETYNLVHGPRGY